MTPTGRKGEDVARVQLPSGIATGIGSLPHRNAAEATAFVLSAMELPAIPTLPRRSPAEGMIAQATVGIQGFTESAPTDRSRSTSTVSTRWRR